MTSPASSAIPVRPLSRSTTDKKLGGVAGGLAAHFSVDATLIRVAFAVSMLFSGAGAIAYLVLFALLPTDTGEPALVAPKPDTVAT